MSTAALGLRALASARECVRAASDFVATSRALLHCLERDWTAAVPARKATPEDQATSVDELAERDARERLARVGIKLAKGKRQ